MPESKITEYNELNGKAIHREKKKEREKSCLEYVNSCHLHKRRK